MPTSSTNFSSLVPTALERRGTGIYLSVRGEISFPQMAETSSGKQARPRKLVKGGTTSTRKHRFESFNQRIAKLNIDPLRRRRPNQAEEEDFATHTSFFRLAVDRWKDLNLSENFSTFIKEVDPICNSLPQVLHYNERIFDLLAKYIERRDPLSLEPLLDLLINFAHDLGARFEKHFSRAVTLLAHLAANHANVEVIEWSFACLAWLFKYLSRLLVPNLQPVFAIMAPLLGRETQKLHTIRFAAEAMSFLIRKAAMIYIKNSKPLEIIINAIRDDIYLVARLDASPAKVHLYQHGLMSLLFNSIKGIERKISSCGIHTYRCMIDLLLMLDHGHNNAVHDVVVGVTVALVHHSDAENFRPIVDTVLDRMKALDSGTNGAALNVCGGLLFVISTVRKGSRIHDWTPILDAMLKLLELINEASHTVTQEIYKAAAVILQSCPLDHVLPKFRLAMETIASDRLAAHFLSFCNYFCDLGRQRFHDLLLPYFSKFIVTKWQENELGLCVLLPKFIQAETLNKLVCPAAWQEHMIKAFEAITDREEVVIRCNSYIELLDRISINPVSKTQIMDMLIELIKRESRATSGLSSRSRLAFGAGLRALAQQSDNDRLTSIWPLLCGQANRYASLPPFLEAMLSLVHLSEIQADDVENLLNVLIENLHSASHDLRKLSIQLVDSLYIRRHSEQAEIIATMLAIENSSLNMESARSLSMQIRKLASQYERASSHEWLQKMVPHFCFGMLTFKLSQVCDDAIVALCTICDSKVGEEIVSSLAFKWLEEDQPRISNIRQSNSAQDQPGSLTEFQCSNLLHVESLIRHDAREIEAAVEHLEGRFDANHTFLSLQIDDAASRALQALIAIPHVAEKRSRQLVPMFLSWAVDEVGHVEIPIGDTNAATAQDGSCTSHRPKRRDQKAMLDLFGHFNNPKVLYRSSDVFNALQGLLANGNVEIQKSALRALFTWKSPGIQPYQENLLNLLDEARFRDEIATFLQVDERNSTIQDEHRPEFMPVLLRLLYGKMIAGTGSGTRAQAVKRKAVLQALSRLDKEYLQEFVYITLGPLGKNRLLHDDRLDESLLAQDVISVRKQVGLVNMMKDMLMMLGDRLSPFSQDLCNALLYCLVRAARLLRSQGSNTEAAAAKDVQISLLKDVRHTGLQCVNLLFFSCPVFTLRPYLPSIFREILSPRLDKLSIETAQSVSGVLQLFSTLASSRASILCLTEYDTRTVASIIDCLDVPSAKDEVRLFVVDEILKSIVKLAKPLDIENMALPEDCPPEIVFERVLQPNMGILLNGAGSLLRKSPSRELLDSSIRLMSALASLVRGPSHVVDLLDICTFLLNQPSHRVSHRSKGDLLNAVQHFVPLVESPLPSDLEDRMLGTISSLFGYFKDRGNRVILSQVLLVLAKKDAELKDVAQLCTSLNAFSTKRIDEPDFDERLKAFNEINERRFREFNPKQWRPILYNMLFYVKDSEELAIRSNAAYALRRCIETNPIASDSLENDSSNLIKKVLLPALRTGVSDSSELVRTEYLNIIAHLIRHNPAWEAVNDMTVLLVSDDEEASFFGNILHIQQHRRLRALRRLATEASQGSLHSTNVAHFFIPLIEHFVFDRADDESAHNLSAETVATIGALASTLEWPQFRAVFRRYSNYIQTKPDVEKTVIRLLGVVIDALSQAAGAKEGTHDQNESGAETETVRLRNAGRTLAITLPRKEKLTDDLIHNLLPALEKYLHDKDESTVSLRVPVAVSVVKLLKLLPSDRLRERLPPVLTDVCHILRSRAQESRDLTRKTLVEISTLIGPGYFGFVLKELRSSLARGYQLHVLSYTVHSILVATSPIFSSGDLDYCLPQVVAIVMDDIFGVTGHEKDAEEYISKMKEVKSSKSYDSLELVAKTVTVEHFVELIRPLQILLEEKLDLRMVRKIDELLRRVGVGLLRNEAIHDQRVLVFCYEIIREVYRKEQTSERTSKEDYRTRRFLINQKGASRSGERGSTTSYNYKLARFALDILRSVLRKYTDLQTPASLSGFAPIIGDALVQPNEEIQISALRLLTTTIKVPLKAFDDNAPIYVSECVKIVKTSTSTNAEAAQAALNLVTAILRERRTVEIRETDLAYLLKRLIPDLEEPDKQGVAFNFLKAIMTRKIVITEIYEIIDAVAVIMVTNQTKVARDMARGAYFHFVMHYPQNRDRFAKQLGFLVRNLEYKHEAGRQSVMEAVHLLLTKVSEDLVQDIIGTVFVPLVMVVVNDDSSRCREMAGALLKTTFERADAERTQSFLNLLRTWLAQSDEPLLNRAAIQMYGLYLDTNGVAAEKEIAPLKSQLAKILKMNLKVPTEADWELSYFALQTFAKMCQTFPEAAFATTSASLWASIRQCLSFPHAWVKLSTAKLLGVYFADFARTNAGNQNLPLPLKGSDGLWLTEQEMIEVTRSSLRLLRVPGVSEDLASQSVRNLVFLGKIMAQTSMTWPQKDVHTTETGNIEEEEKSEDEQQDEDDQDIFEGFDQPPKPALGHLVTQASRLLRRGPLTTRSPSLIPLHSSLQLLGAIASSLPTETLIPHIPALLLPLHNLTDPSIAHPFSTDTAFTDGYKSLVANAQELMTLLQKKLGTTEFVNLLSAVREGVKMRREGRRAKRRIEMVVEPERAGRVKKRKGERKRERRKERSGEMRGVRRGW